MITNKPVRRILEKDKISHREEREYTRLKKKYAEKSKKIKTKTAGSRSIETLHRSTKAALTRKSPEFRRPKNERVEELLRKSHTDPMKIHPLEDCLRVE